MHQFRMIERHYFRRPAVHLVGRTGPTSRPQGTSIEGLVASTWRLQSSSFSVMTCFLARDYNGLPKTELHKSLSFRILRFLRSVAVSAMVLETTHPSIPPPYPQSRAQRSPSSGIPELWGGRGPRARSRRMSAARVSCGPLFCAFIRFWWSVLWASFGMLPRMLL